MLATLGAPNKLMYVTGLKSLLSHKSFSLDRANLSGAYHEVHKSRKNYNGKTLLLRIKTLDS